MLPGMKLAIVGVGKLGTAILSGVMQRGLLAPGEVGLLDVDSTRVETLCAQHGTRPLVAAELNSAERVFLAVRPQLLAEVAAQVARPGVGYISTLAGVTTTQLSRRLGTTRVVRVMPNLGATIGRSQTALVAPPAAHEAGDAEFARQLFGAVGDVYDLPEHLFDAFTGLTGSGPAYLAVAAEALADGGVRMGLPRALARELAARLIASSGELLQGYDHPSQLKDEVASPGGTTIAGIEALEQGGFRAALIAAVGAATRRGTELGREQDG